MQHYDIAVIGSGPGGHGAAIQAAKLGKRAVVVDRRRPLGGDSINLGSVPSKTLREAVLVLTGFNRRDVYGIEAAANRALTIGDLSRRCKDVISRESQVIQDQFRRNRVDVILGEASFRDPHVLAVRQPKTDLEIEADHIVIAVGSRPAHSETVPIDAPAIIDADGVYGLEKIPRTLTVVGAGVIGVEFAGIFAALGIEVTVVDQRERILEFVDEEIIQALMYHMRQRDVIFRLGERVTKVDAHGGRVTAYTASNKRIVSETLLYTVGRHGATEGLGLEAIGLETDERDRILVDAVYRTKIPHVYAVGDVVGFPALASTSQEQGRVAVRHAFGLLTSRADHLLPFGIYSIPEISMVGRTEDDLTEAGTPYETGIAKYRETARGQIIGDTAGLLKLLVHLETKEVLGVHIIGEGAAELIHIGQAVMGLGGTLDYLIDNTFNYPTLAEAYRIAALDASNKLAWSGA